MLNAFRGSTHGKGKNKERKSHALLTAVSAALKNEPRD
jgi:hypothetical protein